MHCNIIIDTFGGGASHSAAISCLEALLVAKTSQKEFPQLAALVSSISVFAVAGNPQQNDGATATVASSLFLAKQLKEANPNENISVHENVSQEQFFKSRNNSNNIDSLLPNPDDKTSIGKNASSDNNNNNTQMCTFFCFSGIPPSKEALLLLRRILVARRTHVVVISALTSIDEIELRGTLETASGAATTSNENNNNNNSSCFYRSALWLRAAHLTPPTKRPANGIAVNNWCSSLLELLCAGIAIGVTRNFPIPASQHADLVPMDIAVNVALLCFLMPQRQLNVKSATSNSRVRELRIVSLLSSPTQGLVWQMVGEYVLDYYGRYEAQLHAEMPHGSFQRDPVLSFKVKLGENAWNYAETFLNAPFNLYRAVQSNKKKGSLLRTPYSATSDRIRSVIQDLDSATKLEQTHSPQFRGAVDEDEEDTYGMLVRYLSQRDTTSSLVLACSLECVEWEPYVKRVAVDVLHFIAVRVMSMPEPPSQLPVPTPMYTNDIHFRGPGRAPAINLPWRRLFESKTFALLAGRQPNGQFVDVNPGGTTRRFHDILAQTYIHSIIEQVAKTDNIDRAAMEARAFRILRGIGDLQNHRDERTLATIVRVVFRQLYTHINVLPRGFLTQSLLFKAWKLPRTTVVLIPSHRSYIDFMVTPYLLCGLGVPLPHIVAGEDFLRLGPLANALRGSGAFFMRRTFKTDRLYAALFKEYVKSLTLQFEWLEFFIEGMRSRSGKTMPPRLGILKMITDSFYEAREGINDVLFIPCALSYERLLESSLYARELLGIPKPPENLANLVKGSVSVIQESYGSLNVNFGEPISLVNIANSLKIPREGETNQAKRAARTFTPANLLTALGGHISQSLDDNMIVTPTAVVSSVLLYMTDRRALRDDGVPLEQIVVNTEWLRSIILRLGGMMSPNFAELDGASLVSYCTNLLQPHINVSRLNRAYTYSSTSNAGGKNKNNNNNIGIRDQITALMALSIYHNGLIHLFLAPGAITVVLGANKRNNINQQQHKENNNNNQQEDVIASAVSTTVREVVASPTGSSVDPKAPASHHQSKSLSATETEVRFIHELLQNEFPFYANLVPTTDPFLVGCKVLEKEGFLAKNNNSNNNEKNVASSSSLTLTNNAFTQFCSMAIYPYIEAYYVAALSLFALSPSSASSGVENTNNNNNLDELNLLSICHRGSLELYESHLVTFAQACNKEMLKTALVAYRVGKWKITKLDQETGLASRIKLNEKYEIAQSAELRKFVLSINQYRWHPANMNDFNLSIQKVLNATKSFQDNLSKL